LLIKLAKNFNPKNLSTVIHHGGDEGVTGSCHELFVSSKESVLIDCGIFQGNEAKANQEIDFDISAIKAVILTHVHIDHVGRMPYLFGAGYKGPIYCSEPSAELLPLVLADAIKIGFMANTSMIKTFLKRLSEQLIAIKYSDWESFPFIKSAQVKIKLKPAGHILGSSYVEIDLKHNNGKQERNVFSGDLGAPYAPLLAAPKSPYAADRVFIESTYGNKEHQSRKERKSTLKKVLLQALQNRGTVLVPAFSIGRTQELLYELEEIIHRYKKAKVTSKLCWEDLDIIVDSPLASRFSEVYKKLKPFWDKEATTKVNKGRHPLSFEQLTTIDTHREHQKCVKYLAKTARPAIVIAASGMCAGGRIMNYLKAMISDPRHDILFVGYQAAGTPGRDIQKYGPRGGYVTLEDKKYVIRAKIETISGYSAHADQSDLVNFIKRMRILPKVVKLIHGDPDAKKSLRKQILKNCSLVELVVQNRGLES